MINEGNIPHNYLKGSSGSFYFTSKKKKISQLFDKVLRLILLQVRRRSHTNIKRVSDPFCFKLKEDPTKLSKRVSRLIPFQVKGISPHN